MPIVRFKLLLHPSLGPDVPRDGNPLTLAPLTGKVMREVGEREPNRDFGDPDKIEEEGI